MDITGRSRPRHRRRERARPRNRPSPGGRGRERHDHRSAHVARRRRRGRARRRASPRPMSPTRPGGRRCPGRGGSGTAARRRELRGHRSAGQGARPRRQPAPLADFEQIIRVNLIGTYNVIAPGVRGHGHAPIPTADGDRGVIVNTASVAAFDGQIGQPAYSASKGGVHAMTLPIARELARYGIRVCTIAPGIMETPMLMGLPQAAQDSLGQQVPYPARLGRPDEYARTGDVDRRQRLPQRRDDPPRRRDPDGTAMSGVAITQPRATRTPQIRKASR